MHARIPTHTKNSGGWCDIQGKTDDYCRQHGQDPPAVSTVGGSDAGYCSCTRSADMLASECFGQRVPSR